MKTNDLSIRYKKRKLPSLRAFAKREGSEIS